MDIQTSKLELIKRIVDIDNPATINSLLSILQQADEKPTGLYESENQEIELGIEQLDRGQRISMTSFLEKYK